MGCGDPVADRQQPQSRFGRRPGSLDLEGQPLLGLVDQPAQLGGRIAERFIDDFAGPGLFPAAALHLGIFANGRQGCDGLFRGAGGISLEI